MDGRVVVRPRPVTWLHHAARLGPGRPGGRRPDGQPAGAIATIVRRVAVGTRRVQRRVRVAALDRDGEAVAHQCARATGRSRPSSAHRRSEATPGRCPTTCRGHRPRWKSLAVPVGWLRHRQCALRSADHPGTPNRRCSSPVSRPATQSVDRDERPLGKAASPRGGFLAVRSRHAWAATRRARTPAARCTAPMPGQRLCSCG